MKKNISIVGCGNIGSFVAGHIEKNLSDAVEAVILYDVDTKNAEKAADNNNFFRVAGSLEEAVDKCDMVIEAASPVVARLVLETATKEKKDAMIISVGGLLGYETLLEEAGKVGINVILPSGAISGIDAVKSMKIAGIHDIRITTRKSPRSIKGAPYLLENNIDVDKISGEEVIFEGNAIEAMKGFPKNINVSALLSIAGIGGEKTKVRIMVSPEYTRNTHEIEVIGEAGRLVSRTENVPSPMNPKTSYLANLSVAAALNGYFDTIRPGT